jgi:hypothetical protein
MAPRKKAPQKSELEKALEQVANPEDPRNSVLELLGIKSLHELGGDDLHGTAQDDRH